MPDTLTLEIRGLDQLQRNLIRLAQEGVAAAGAALREEAEIEMTEAKERTPVRYGVLKASGTVTGPEGPEQAVRMSFGGDAREYAIFVHENLEMFHRVGQAKFLESVLLESIPYLTQRVAANMRRRLYGSW